MDFFTEKHFVYEVLGPEKMAKAPATRVENAKNKPTDPDKPVEDVKNEVDKAFADGQMDTITIAVEDGSPEMRQAYTNILKQIVSTEFTKKLSLLGAIVESNQQLAKKAPKFDSGMKDKDMAQKKLDEARVAFIVDNLADYKNGIFMNSGLDPALQMGFAGLTVKPAGYETAMNSAKEVQLSPKERVKMHNRIINNLVESGPKSNQEGEMRGLTSAVLSEAFKALPQAKYNQYLAAANMFYDDSTNHPNLVKLMDDIANDIADANPKNKDMHIALGLEEEPKKEKDYESMSDEQYAAELVDNSVDRDLPIVELPDSATMTATRPGATQE